METITVFAWTAAVPILRGGRPLARRHSLTVRAVITQHVADTVLNTTGGIGVVTDDRSHGGHTTHEPAEPALAVDKDGMPDTWKRNPDDPSDNAGDRDKDGGYDHPLQE